MDSAVEFLKKISKPPRQFNAEVFISSVINSEIQNFKYRSQQGFFHEYVKKNGYPIPKNVLSETAYVDRPILENKIRAAVEKRQSVILLGCEGSGKTTVIHRVFGDEKFTKKIFPIYVDVSDVIITDMDESGTSVFEKIRNALLKSINPTTKNAYRRWFEKNQSDPFVGSFFGTNSAKSFTETFLLFLQTRTHLGCIYLIIDNIDSVSLQGSKEIFSTINSLRDSIKSFCASSDDEFDQENLRYLVCCRTPTYRHVSGHTHGLFLDFSHEVVVADDDFSKNLNILELINSFLNRETEYIFGTEIPRSIKVNLGGVDITLTVFEYFNVISSWMQRNRNVFNDTIKMFSGRSIRRAKLYGAKTFANPVVARLALFERYNIVSITRQEPTYLKRRLQEAIFDFRVSDSAQVLGLVGFPMNPFRIILDEEEYKQNPLIGVIGIDYIKRNSSSIAEKKIYFAGTVDVSSLLEQFEKMGFAENAIKEFFVVCSDSGLLRPILSSKVLLGDTDHRSVYQNYVIDSQALESYHSLIFFKNPKLSLSFYNSALRAYYDINSDHLIDNSLFELLCGLIFMRDLIQREKKLELMITGSGVLFETVTSRIRRPCLRLFSEIIEKNFSAQQSTSKNAQFQRQLEQLTLELMRDIKRKLASRPSMI